MIFKKFKMMSEIINKMIEIHTKFFSSRNTFLDTFILFENFWKKIKGLRILDNKAKTDFELRVS